MEMNSLRDRALKEGSTVESKCTYLESLIRDGHLEEARSIVKLFPPEVRREIAHPSSGTYNPRLIFKAVEKGRPKFIRFLVEEFNVDLEEEYVYPSCPPYDVYTPLSYALMMEHARETEELIRLGANVNAFSPKTGLSILHRACRAGFLSIAKRLIAKGADLKRTDNEGFTALMHGVRLVSVCAFLIANGADIETTNIFGNTALHVAAEHAETGTVMLLLERGADPLQMNIHGDDVLRVACIACATDIVEELMDRMSGIDIRRRIEVHQLLGASHLFCDRSQSGEYSALRKWERAIELREKNRHLIVKDDSVSTPNPAYDDAVEIDSITELDKIRQDKNMIHMQGLLLTEKILGPNHRKTVSEVIRTGKAHMKNKDCTRGLRLLGYGLKLSCDRWSNSRDRPFYIENMEQICKCLDSLTKLNDVGNRLEFEDVYRFLKITAFQAKRLIDTETNASIDKQPEQNQHLVQIVLYMIKLFFCQTNSEEQRAQFKSVVRDIVRLNLRSSGGRTLLMNSISVYPLYTPAFLEIDVIRYVLDCGARATERDDSGNSVLHALAKPPPFQAPTPAEIISSRMEAKKVAEMLLEYGAHVDVKNNKGASVSGLLKCLGLNSPNPLSLQCLAAQAIRRHKVPYVGILAKSLAEFVEIH